MDLSQYQFTKILEDVQQFVNGIQDKITLLSREDTVTISDCNMDCPYGLVDFINNTYCFVVKCLEEETDPGELAILQEAKQQFTHFFEYTKFDKVFCFTMAGIS